MSKQPSPTNQLGTISDGIRAQIVSTASDKVKAPENIITNPTAARSIYYTYRAEHLKRIALYASIEGLIAGNPPYNPVDLHKQGLSHIANFNNLDARSLYERSALAYWNLLNEAETLCEFTIRGLEDEQLALQYATILATNWDKVIRKWPSFNTQVNMLSAQIIKFGISPIIWSDERSWKWRTIELSKFYVADQALTDIEQLTSVCVETTFTAQYLYEVYHEFKDKPADKSPWNMKELARLLLYRANSMTKNVYDVTDMMDLQVRLQNGDISYNLIYSDSIKIISLLYKEYEGGISHYMFERTFDDGSFLYYGDKQYQKMNEAIVIFTASPGEFTIHSNRGVGHKIFSGCQATMQLDCDIVNVSRWSSTPLLKGIATGSKDFEATRVYPGVATNIGTAEFVQNTMGANINQLIGASNYLTSKMQYNAGNSGDDPSQPDKSVGSIAPSQFRAQSFKEFGVLKHNIAHFYSQFDLVIQNMVAKMWHSKSGYPDYDACKEWKQKCIEDGVPEIIFDIKNESKDEYCKLPRHIEVSATRVAGDGSTLAILMGLQELAPDVASFSAKGQREYQKQKVRAVFGRQYVNAFISDIEPDEAAGGASLAGMENVAMKMGESPVFSVDNEQRPHFVTHLALGNDIITRLQQQQITPVDADKQFTVLIPHMTEHWQTIVSNPYMVEFVGQVKDSWNQLSEYARLNRKNAASMMQAEIKKKQEMQEKEQQVMSEQEIKDMVAKRSEARSDFKVEAQNQRANKANDTRAEIMKTKVEKDADNQRLKIQLENSSNKTVENTPLPELRSNLNNLNGRTVAPADIELPL